MRPIETPTPTPDPPPVSPPPVKAVQNQGPALGRTEYVMLLAMLMASVALGIDMMLPAFDHMRVTFGLTPGSTEIAGTITAYFLGMSAAQLFFGPLSDRFGRRPIIFVGLGIYTAGAIASALAPSLSLLLIARFVWGIGAAGGRVVVTAIVRDSFAGDAMAKMISTLMAVFLLVPIIAPTLGSLIVAIAPWRAVFWVAAVIAVALGIWAMVRLPESLPVEQRQPIRLSVLKRSGARVFREPATLLPMLGITALTAVFTSYLGSAELIIGDIFDRRDQFPLIFGASAVMFGAASLLNGRLVDRFGMRRIFIPAMALYLGCSLVLLIQALATDGRPSFWLFYPVLSLLLSASMVVNPNLNAMALLPLGDIAGTASSIVGAVSLATGTLAGAMIDSQLEGTLTPFAVALVATGVITSLLVVRMLAVDRPGE